MDDENKAILVAKYFIWKSKTDPKPTGLGKLKLQKLLYYSQAWNLVLNEEPIFEDQIEAWVHGPAILNVFRYFKNLNFSDIKIEDNDFESFSSNEKKLLDEIWEVYGKYDGKYLENLTHDETPWQAARGKMDESEPSQNVISTASMIEFYGKRLKEVA